MLADSAPGIELMSPALAGRCFITDPPGKNARVGEHALL